MQYLRRRDSYATIQVALLRQLAGWRSGSAGALQAQGHKFKSCTGHHLSFESQASAWLFCFSPSISHPPGEGASVPSATPKTHTLRPRKTLVAAASAAATSRFHSYVSQFVANSRHYAFAAASSISRACASEACVSSPESMRAISAGRASASSCCRLVCGLPSSPVTLRTV